MEGCFTKSTTRQLSPSSFIEQRSKIVKEIHNLLAENNCTYAGAKLILHNAIDELGAISIVQKPS